MNTKCRTRAVCWVLVAVLVSAVSVVCEEPRPGLVPDTKPEVKRVSVATARDQAKLMHEVYAATLEVMHQHYFDVNKSVLPARAMEDVFAEMARQSNLKARWIAVNTKAMSVHHEPKTDFEKKAASEIASGKEMYEQVENGVYHRAGVIPLTAGCISCHAGFFMTPPKTPRYAGLVISVPVQEK